jgi:hypothetical protein
MHIITGLLLAGILGKSKTGRPRLGLPMYKTGPIRVVHALPGRIRFHVPALVDAPEAHHARLGALKKIEGIDDVITSPITGNIVVSYRSDMLEPILVFGAIVRLLGLERALEETPMPAVAKELRMVEKSLSQALLDRSNGVVDLKTIAALALLISGGIKVAKDGLVASLPTGITLLWWGLNAIPKGK